MGQMNWIAVLVAALVAGMISIEWFNHGLRRLGDEQPRRRALRILATDALLLVTSVMLGHMFARVGADTLAAKPWLYFMMSGGVALAFVIPSLWISLMRMGAGLRAALIDGGVWLAIYLSMGGVFYLLS